MSDEPAIVDRRRSIWDPGVSWNDDTRTPLTGTAPPEVLAQLRGYTVAETPLDSLDKGALERQINVMPWPVALAAAQVAVARGISFQRWVCSNCGAIQTMPHPNEFFEGGHCEECDGLTDLRQAGFDVVAFITEPKGQRILTDWAAEMAASEDNVKLRARGIEPKTKPVRPPCHNCGEPFHKGRCQILMQSGRKRRAVR